MSKYTTQLRYICESLAGREESAGFNDVESIIETAAPLIFDFDFPMQIPEHKTELIHAIIRHYYTREIGAESYGLWKLWLKDTMLLIMPKYNELYRIAELAKTINPFIKESETETRNVTRHDEGNNNGIRTDSDTPRGALTGVIDDKYLSYAQQNKNDMETDGTENVVANREVKHYDAADILRRYRENVYNIDMMIIDELKPLFIGLW